VPRTAILFDLDGTLVDSARDIAAALTRLSRERGGDAVAAATVRPLVSLGASALVARALGPVAGDAEEDMAGFRALLRDAPSDPAIVFPGVEGTLAALTGAGWQLAVVTNKPCSLATALLGTHRLDRFFAAVVGGDTAPRQKPDPAPLRYALAALGAAPTGALFVGDSGVDAAAAAALAIPLLLYTGGYGADEVSGEAARFDQFTALPALAETFR
jgi:phosphoglycolate phosphatase